MRSITVGRVLSGAALLLSCGWVNQAHAQFGAGTSWVRTDAQGKGITLTVEACCKGGLRLIYQLPSVNAGQPGLTLTVDSPMDGTEVPTMVAGKPSGQTMTVTRMDDHHYSAVVKLNGQVFTTSNATVSPDGKAMTIEDVTQGKKIVETWVRK